MKLLIRTSVLKGILMLMTSILLLAACKKFNWIDGDKKDHGKCPATAPFDLNVDLRGEAKKSGHIKFRQDPDAVSIVNLDIKVDGLAPNNSYLLQRAVDPLDCNCTSNAWLTLGRGLDPQAIATDAKGKANVQLFRSLSAFPAGTTFDIHFQVIDSVTSVVVLTSDCYQFTVR